MPKNNKEAKLRRQQNHDISSAMPRESTFVRKPNMTKTGAPLSLSKPIETWDKTSERAAIGRRNKKMKVTLPKMPWDNEE